MLIRRSLFIFDRGLLEDCFFFLLLVGNWNLEDFIFYIVYNVFKFIIFDNVKYMNLLYLIIIICY